MISVKIPKKLYFEIQQAKRILNSKVKRKTLKKRITNKEAGDFVGEVFRQERYKWK